MSDVISLFERDRCTANRSDINIARREYGLSLVQGAKALGISATNLERLERGEIQTVSLEDAKRGFEVFIATSGEQAGKNLVFRTYPMRVARELLGLTLPVMAERYGYSAETWKKIESNSRPISSEKMKLIEGDVRNYFANVCNLSF